MIQGAYIIGTTDEETGKQKIYFRTQPNNQRRLFDLVFKEAPKQSNLYILAGGSLGSGKTKAVVGLTVAFCSKFPGSRVYVGRKDFNDLRDTFYKDFVSICPRNLILKPQGDLAERTEAAHDVLLQNGSLIMFRELKDLQGKLGLEVNLIVLEQAEEIDETVYRIMDSRLRPWTSCPKKSPFVMLLTANPNPGWTKRMFVDNETLPPSRKIKNHHYLFFSPADNVDLLKIRPNYYTEMAAKYPLSWVKRYLQGDWNIAVEGAIFPEYDPAIHFIPPFHIPDDWLRFMCLDPHLAKPFDCAWLAQAPGGPSFIYDEFEGEIDEPSRDFFTRMLERERAHSRQRLSYNRLIDYSLAGVLHKRNDGLALWDIIREMGLRFRQASKVNKWENILGVKEILRPRTGTPPLLYVFNTCVKTDAQFKAYRYNPHEPGTDFSLSVVKEEDDFMDIVQYMVADKPWIKKEVDERAAISYTNGFKKREVPA